MHRLTGWLAGVAFVVPTLLLATSSPAAAATTTTDPAKAAAGYLARQLTGPAKDHYVFSFDGTTADDGLTADGLFAMAGTKASGAAQQRAAAWLATDAPNYVQDFEVPTQKGPGQLAKLALVAETRGVDPDTFAPAVPLITELQQLECPAVGRADCAPDEVGKFKNTAPSGGFPSVLVQSLAVLALARDASGADAAAVDFLVHQQCPNGSFPAAFVTAGGACTGDVDTTGYAVQALVAAKAPAALTALATGWLRTQQHPDGGYFGTGSNAENANSTALAATAFNATGQEASGALGYLRRLQVGCSGPVTARGAVNLSFPISAAHPFSADEALRATTQAGLALAGGSLVDVTSAGSTTADPVLACAAAPAPTPSPSPSGPAPVQNRPTSGAVATAAPTLPNTGAPGLPVTLGTGGLLVAVGAMLRVLARRRRVCA